MNRFLKFSGPLFVSAFLAVFSFETIAETPRPNLTGRVLSGEESPLQGATVFIYTAGPREGVGILCPSCYADCTKKSTTDQEGQFTIADLDPSLLFNVLVVAKGHQPKIVDKVDPLKEPMKVNLLTQSPPENPKQQMLGRVLDLEGSPVEGAVVGIRGVSRGESTRFGGNKDVDPIAVSDVNGLFAITSTEPFEAVGVEVEARGFAKGIFGRLETGESRHDLKLTKGVTVQGRVMLDDKPLPGVEVGISGAERRSEIYVGNWTVATGPDGRFLFSNLPANTAYQLYGKSASLAEHGCIPSRIVRTQSDESTLDVGELKVEPAFRVEGRLVLTDDGAIPDHTPILLGRDEAWDSQESKVENDGRFAFAGVPPESISISVRVKGYRLSARNANIDPLNPYHLIGTVNRDNTNLLIELEPGPNHTRLAGDQNALQREPIRGVEPPGEIPDGIQVSGSVLDAESGHPLEKFTVTEGRDTPYGEGMTWHSSRKTDFSDGKFSLSFTKQPEAPAILIEAEGYMPAAVGPISPEGTNVVLKLKKGSGIEAVLLRPDGDPASNVTVYLTDTGRNGVYVDPSLKVRENTYQGTKATKTDAQGKFSFPPQVDAFSVIVVDDAGFANTPVTELADKQEIRLQPWARVKGKLMIGSKPGADESIRLWPAHIPYADHPRQFPALNIYLNTKTDQDGAFEFPRVPPMAIEVYHEPKVRDSRMGTIAVSQNTKFNLAPGETKVLTLGGKGRPVVGKFVVNGYDEKIDWRADVYNIELVVPEPPELPNFKTLSTTYSAAFQNAGSDEEKAALQQKMAEEREKLAEETRAFYQTEGGIQHHFAKRRYALNFSQDGSFRIDDVSPGKYTLNLDLRENTGDSFNRFAAPKIASINKEIGVPEMDGDRTDEPLDLGTIELQARTQMKPGKPAPDFEVRTVDDKTVKLSDYAGKFLLLDFWAVWCGPCVAETPNLKETYDEFKDDERFAFLGLSLDPDVAAPRKYAEKNDLGWTQGFLGEWSQTDIPARFGVESIPSIFLIGPDGKIVATGLRGAAIKSAVEKALAKE